MGPKLKSLSKWDPFFMKLESAESPNYLLSTSYCLLSLRQIVSDEFHLALVDFLAGVFA